MLAAAQNAGHKPTAEERRQLADDLVQCVARGLVRPHASRDAFTSVVNACPAASPMARLQAGRNPYVTNRRHEPVFLDQISQNVLRHLDGKHDREALVQVLIEAVDRGWLSIFVNGLPATSGRSAIEVLRPALDRCLERLAKDALLIA